MTTQPHADSVSGTAPYIIQCTTQSTISYTTLCKRLWLLAMVCVCDGWICLLLLWQMPFFYGLSLSTGFVQMLSLILLVAASLSIISIIFLLWKLPAEAWRGKGEITSARCLLVLSADFVAMTLCLIFYSLFFFYR